MTIIPTLIPSVPTFPTGIPETYLVSVPVLEGYGLISAEASAVQLGPVGKSVFGAGEISAVPAGMKYNARGVSARGKGRVAAAITMKLPGGPSALEGMGRVAAAASVMFGPVVGLLGGLGRVAATAAMKLPGAGTLGATGEVKASVGGVQFDGGGGALQGQGRVSASIPGISLQSPALVSGTAQITATAEAVLSLISMGLNKSGSATMAELSFGAILGWSVDPSYPNTVTSQQGGVSGSTFTNGFVSGAGPCRLAAHVVANKSSIAGDHRYQFRVNGVQVGPEFVTMGTNASGNYVFDFSHDLTLAEGDVVQLTANQTNAAGSGTVSAGSYFRIVPAV